MLITPCTRAHARARFRCTLMFIYCSIVLAGCAVVPAPRPQTLPQGNATYHIVETADTKHYRLTATQVARGADVRVNPTPVYPAELLALRLPPVELQAKLIVGVSGRVSEVRVEPVKPGATTQPFVDAVRAAAVRWEFAPLVIDHWAPDAHGGRHLVDGEAQPFSQDYVFRFECRDGKPVVSTNATTAL